MDECPYPGLAAFGPEQARWFFGRDRLLAELTARLDERAQRGGPLMVVAPSGAGKSSLLRAGLMPALEDGALPGSRHWPRLLFTPTAQPMAALTENLAACADIEPAQVREAIAAGAGQYTAMLRRVLRDRGVDQDAGGARLVMIVDQLEELFTQCTDPSERRRFVDVISHLAGPAPDGVRPVALVVCGLRSDFYTPCADHPRLRAALQDAQVFVGPMSQVELREAIVYPAQDVGLEVEPGLVEVLLSNLGTGTGDGYAAGRLPLLAHALRTTWQQRHGHTLTVEGYRVTGGIQQAVATTAERIFTGLDPEDQQMARIVFLRLVTIGDSIEDTRRRVARADLLITGAGSAAAVVDAFTQGRLLMQTQDTVEITHEALLSAWPRLRTWIEADRAGLLIRQHLIDAAADWRRDGQDPSGLYRGTRLAIARNWVAGGASPSGLDPVTEEFLQAGIRLEESEQRAVKRRTRRLRLLAGALAVLLVAALAAAGVAFDLQRAAVRQQLAATARQLMALATASRDSDPRAALRFAVAADRLSPGAATQASLVDILTTTRYSGTLTGHTSAVVSAAFSPDGRIAATGNPDQVIIWDFAGLARPRALGRLPDVDNGARGNELAFFPDGRTLMTAGSLSGDVLLWDVTRPGEPRPLSTLQSQPGETVDDRVGATVYSLAVSPDGRTLAVGCRDGTITLWDAAEAANPRRLRRMPSGFDGAVSELAFSPDGRTLAVGSYLDEKILLWDVSRPMSPHRVGGPLQGPPDTSGQGEFMYSMAFSPAHDVLAAGRSDGTALLWDVSDPAKPRRLGESLTGHAALLRSVAFSRDGRTLATGSEDTTVILWDLSDPAKPNRLESLTGHHGAVHAAAFAPDGTKLLTASLDASAIVWDLRNPSRLRQQGEPLMGGSVAAFSSTGRILATTASMSSTTGAEHQVNLWDLANPVRPTRLGGLRTDREGSIGSLTFSPDGHTLASTSILDKTVVLWDVTAPGAPRRLGSLTGHGTLLRGTAFSPTGSVLASVSHDAVILWDVSEPARPHELARLTGLISSSVAFSADGHTIAVTTELASAQSAVSVTMWDVTDPGRPRRLGTDLTGTATPAFSANGRLLATANDLDSTAILWDVTDPTRPRRLGQPLTGHTGKVRTLAFSPDGHTLATGGNDNTVILWDLTDRTQPRPIGRPLTVGRHSYVGYLSFSPDGTSLATGSGIEVILWDLTGLNDLRSHAAQRACAIAGGPLDREQWLRYLSELPYQDTCSPAR
ncbi:AAA family ATPase [Nonomuraea sp. NPDC050643]|uniref:NACHT and WD repeat domain-containing protein n=1 Tax=Nonomuraea sp. NPDC050643 TaxID=3155660 RepID=UPI003409DE4F